MDVYEQLSQATGFDWDAGNVEKNWRKHQVSAAECEQVFFNPDPAREVGSGGFRPRDRGIARCA